MTAFLWIISVFWIVLGILFLLVPVSAKHYVKAISKLPKALLGIIPAVIGILLLLASPVSNLNWFIAILGMLALLKGIFVLISPRGLIKATFSWWFNQTPSLYRLWGIIMIVLALFVIGSITG